MSANIGKKNDGTDALVLAKTPAWHSLGTVLNNAFNAKTALEQGGLDFEVIKLRNKMENDVEIPDSYSLVRVDRANDPKGKGILGICGKNYKPLQNDDLFSFFDYLVDEKLAIYESAGVLGNGERVWILAKLNSEIVVGSNKDVINQYVLITNSHTGKHSAIAMVTPVRVVCQNTLNIALGSFKNAVKIRHFQNAQEKLREAHKVLGFSTKYYEELSKSFDALKRKTVKDGEVVKYVNSLLQIKDQSDVSTKKLNQFNKIMSLYEGGDGNELMKGSMWGAFNAVAEYVDYHKTVRVGFDDTKALESIWFGDGYKLKQQAYNLATKIASK